jgi:hypothetical protein
MRTRNAVTAVQPRLGAWVSMVSSRGGKDREALSV